MFLKKIISRVLIFLIVAIPYLPLFGEIDRIASQWAILSGISFISILILFIYNEIDNPKILYSRPIIYYSLFLLFGLISFTSSINLVESLVEFFRYLSVLLLLIVLPTLTIRFNNSYFLIILLLFFSVIDIIGIFLQNNYGLPLIGFTGNKNIASASLILKSNSILFLLYKYNNIYIKIFSYIFLTLTYIVILLIGSKAGVITSIIINLIILLIFILFHQKFQKNLIYILAFITSILVSNLYNSNFQTALTDTVNYTNDPGSTDRLKYYTQALQSFTESPFFGVGLGNWKIKASKYDSNEMNEYIVQYHTHNDYLQLLAEVGIGVIFYILFIISIFKILYDILKRENILFSNQSSIFILTFLGIVVYFIDSNLNFPAARVVMQINLASILAIIISLNQNGNSFK